MFAVDKQAHSSCYEGVTPFQSILFRCNMRSLPQSSGIITPGGYLAKIFLHHIKSARSNFVFISGESTGPGLLSIRLQ
jgi:hypothetical protein